MKEKSSQLWMKPVIYIYIYNEIKKRENNHFTFHFIVNSGINILVKTWKDRNWYDGLY